MNTIAELFGRSVKMTEADWQQILSDQRCPFIGRKCYKVRKSAPDMAIGTCTVFYGRRQEPIVICPTRLIERGQVFTDCFHLLTTHEPGNELHLVAEVPIPGGSVDYFLVSAWNGRVRDFVGIEIQTLDTTGTVWPERQRFLHGLGISHEQNAGEMGRPFGINWKMTAKTTLLQIHHKIQTFEHLNKKLVLVMQDMLLDYMAREFNFGHVRNPAAIGDSMHFHAYRMMPQSDHSLKILLQNRWSTDAYGVGLCLGLQTEARVELTQICEVLQARLSSNTLFVPRF